jgi:hypothetical protein
MDASELTPDLVGRDVIDAAGQRIGRLDRLYRDIQDPAICFAAVAMIRRGRRRLVYVSLVAARLDPTSITVQCGALLARRAPQTRPGRELPVEREADLYRHYDIPYPSRDGGPTRLQSMQRHGGHRR